MYSKYLYSDKPLPSHCSQDMFTSMKVVGAVELSLGGNAALSDIHRLNWNTQTATKPGLSVVYFSTVFFTVYQ